MAETTSNPISPDLILKNLFEGIIPVDPHGFIVYWNDAAESIFGYSAAEILGKPFSRLYPAQDIKAFQRHLEAVLQGRSFDEEWEGVRKNGTRVWLHIRASAMKDSNDRTIGAMALARDISDKKRKQLDARDNEPLYRAVGESIRYGVWVCDPAGRLTHMSNSFLELLGLTRDQNISDGWINALHPDERVSIMNAWRESLSKGTPWNRRYNILGADGFYHSVLTHGAPVRDTDGKILCWAGLNLDVEQLK